MKILLSHFSLYRKNGWGRLFEEAKGLASLGHDVTVFCSKHRKGFIYEKKNEEGVKVILFNDVIPYKYLNSGYGFLSLLNKCIYTLFCKFDICMSNAHRPTAFKPCLFNRLVYGSKVVIEWWDDFATKAERLTPKNPITKYQIQKDLRDEISTKLNADGIVPLSNLMFEKAILLGINSSKIQVVHGGCDTTHLRFNPLNTYKATIGLDSDTVTFGFIGAGDVEMSDLKVFFAAALDLCKSYKVKFLNFGHPFKKVVSNNPSLKEFIIECGWVDYYGDNTLLSATDIFVLIKQDNLENNAGWPNKFGDYLAIGRPILVNPYGEIISFAKQWNPGIISVKYTKESILKAIVDVCNKKYDLESMAIKNRTIAQQNTWLDRAQELEAFFITLEEK